MLSYQHIYHAGNLADVHKHALLSWILAYLTRKEKPVSYIETHSGRALYDLDAQEALKTGEAAAGIDVAEAWFQKDHPYSTALTEIRAQEGSRSYPGSPRLAATLLRKADQLHLAELHPGEVQALRHAMKGQGAKIYQQDGFELAQSLVPPTPRRGLLLIDPSYEIKSDYKTIPDAIANIHRKWNVGIVALWYPILTDGVHVPMLKALEAKGFPEVLRHEVLFPPAREGHRMVGSGLFILNTPYGCAQEAAWLSKRFRALR